MSFLAYALGHKSCLQGYKTTYLNMNRLIEKVTLSKLDGSYIKLLTNHLLYRPSLRNLVAITPGFETQLIILGNPKLDSYIHHNISTEYSFCYGKKGSYAYTGLDFNFSNNFYNSFSQFDSSIGKRMISYR